MYIKIINAMEIEDKYIDISNSICLRCEHMVMNNLDKEIYSGCRAFPKGIPNKMLLAKEHSAPVEGQVGDYVFKQAIKNYVTGEVF